MKNIIIFGVVLVIIVLGYLFISGKDETTPAVQVQTETEVADAEKAAKDFVDGVVSASESEQSEYEVIEVTFAHVKPGEYSEVYVSVSNVEPGTGVRVSLSGVDVDDGSEQLLGADSNGTANFTFRVYAYGMYHARTVFEGDNAVLMRSISVD